MAEEATNTTPPEHPGGGPVPGRTRRRGALPGSEPAAGGDTETRKGSPASSTSSPPIGTPLNQPQQATDPDELAYTAKPKLPDAKVWGLRVSEQHYDTANTMVDVLATQFRLDKRQVGELIIQFLVNRRFELYNYVKEQVGPAPVNLDFFSPDHAAPDLNAAE